MKKRIHKRFLSKEYTIILAKSYVKIIGIFRNLLNIQDKVFKNLRQSCKYVSLKMVCSKLLRFIFVVPSKA